MCCYVFCIPELAKERRQWCRYVSPDGCSLHDKERPPVCTGYKCVWLQHPEIPDRYRPDRIGCVATDYGNRVVHVCQAYKGAATRLEAARFIDSMAAGGVKVLILWEQGDEREYYVRYDRRRYPVPPTVEELSRMFPNSIDNSRNIAYFEQTGQSPCLWQPQQAQVG